MSVKTTIHRLSAEQLNALSIQQSKNQMSSLMNNEVVILNTKSGIYFSLNKTGAWIWDQIKSRQNFSDILHKGSAELSVSEEAFSADLTEILQQPADEELIDIQ